MASYSVSPTSLKVIPYILGAFVLLFLFKSIFVFVPPGHTGVVYDRGRGVLEKPLNEGLNIVIPLWQTVTLMDTRLQEYTMSSAVDEGALTTRRLSRCPYK